MKVNIVRKKLDNNMMGLSFNGEISIRTVAGIKDFVIKELDACSGVTVDLTNVNEADTAGFQLIIFLKGYSGSLGKTFIVTGLSGRLESIFSLYRERLGMELQYD